MVRWDYSDRGQGQLHFEQLSSLKFTCTCKNSQHLLVYLMTETDPLKACSYGNGIFCVMLLTHVTTISSLRFVRCTADFIKFFESGDLPTCMVVPCTPCKCTMWYSMTQNGQFLGHLIGYVMITYTCQNCPISQFVSRVSIGYDVTHTVWISLVDGHMYSTCHYISVRIVLLLITLLLKANYNDIICKSPAILFWLNSTATWFTCLSSTYESKDRFQPPSSTGLGEEHPSSEPEPSAIVRLPFATTFMRHTVWNG